MEKLLVENIAPSIRASNTHLQTFTFAKVDMGEKVMGRGKYQNTVLGDSPTQ